ncbi:MAG: aldehyde ferredoxin oxidoreductase [Zestosphaera tikiterensis]|uniref:Aldehyde ferredoxin oxidoreductase n=1 Tax=Zestosphaera tikiterensis TaxID=1973259 RepID=A0A2R7Y801_9CREN|nr:MAG: aldehyde ferredoxin oxidoreductase [Zestosphaera tikiterensis]
MSYFGLTGNLLDVDLSTGKTSVSKVHRITYRMFLGGRGLATYILWRELGRKWRQVDPLSPENLLIVMTGPLTGYYPGIKLVVSGKSPQSNGVVGSAISTDVAYALKSAGYDGLIVRGASKDPVYIYVEDDKVEVRDAGRLWGLKGSEFLEALRKDLGRDLPSLYIGPAGENLVRTSVVMSRWFHAAGYGGYGAVMGSKKLKAIVVKGSGPLPKVANPEEFLKLRYEVLDKVSQRKTFRQWGTTAGLWSTGHDTSSEPIKNWIEEWHDNTEFSHVVMERKYWVKNPWADWGCPLACMKVSKVSIDGKTYYTDGPDYEMGAYLGSNLGVFKVEEATALSSLADELGLCGIQTGNALGFALELYERGYLSREDLGYELSWGDFKCLSRLLEDVAFRRGFGAVLAEGTYRAALKIAELKKVGVDELLQYAVQVKGVGVGAHGIRSRKDYPQPIAYAASVQGGDHTSVAGLPANSEESEAWAVLIDSGVVCMFTAIDDTTMIKYLNAVTGWNLSKEEFYGVIAPRILSLQRILLLLGGSDVVWDPRKHDDNPPRFYEPLPSGPYKGAKGDSEEVKSKLKEYYLSLGWDELGIPTEETLKKLGLYDAVEVVRNLRKELTT